MQFDYTTPFNLYKGLIKWAELLGVPLCTSGPLSDMLENLRTGSLNLVYINYYQREIEQKDRQIFFICLHLFYLIALANRIAECLRAMHMAKTSDSRAFLTNEEAMIWVSYPILVFNFSSYKTKKELCYKQS